MIGLSARRRRAARRRRLRFVRGCFSVALLLALACAVLGPGLEWIERHIYRIRYQPALDHYAAEQGIPPAFAAAIIFHESRFNPDAVSSVGARGLMQIMPETGEWIAGKLGEKDAFSAERLFDPEVSIRYGCWYLGFLSRLFGGDPVKIAASYHAGQNAVAGWLEDPDVSPDGWTLTLESIPYPDTRQYAERVVKTFEIYQKIYYAP